MWKDYLNDCEHILNLAIKMWIEDGLWLSNKHLYELPFYIQKKSIKGLNLRYYKVTVTLETFCKIFCEFRSDIVCALSLSCHLQKKSYRKLFEIQYTDLTVFSTFLYFVVWQCILCHSSGNLNHQIMTETVRIIIISSTKNTEIFKGT